MPEPTDADKPVSKELSGRIGSKYQILHSIGKGAMGQVYKAHDTSLDRDVAVKVMVAQIADDPELKQRFEREARAIAKMQHPNLVTVFDLGEHEGSPYFVMEFLKGQDLQKAVRQPPPMTLERKVAIIVQVLAGLAHAHQQGIVHRDIKPANIFIQDDGAVKIMDFGVARLSGHTMTADGNIVGTADYMSPEQVQGKAVDLRSDLFSVGCMLFELAAGRRPFHSDNLMAIFYKITHEEANFDLIPQGEDYDALMPILKKALAKASDERYQTAAEFAIDLREWLRAHATTASSQNVLESLVDLEAPTHPPLAATDAPGLGFAPTDAGATVDLGKRGPRKTMPPTRIGGRTGPSATLRPGATRVVAAPPLARPSPRPRPVARAGVPAWVLVALAVIAGAVGWLGWQVFRSQQGPAAPPATQVAARPTPAPAAIPTSTPAAPPVTVAPAPTFEEAGGKAAAQVRAAQAAFKAGGYDRAVAAAQEALREDPGSASARKLLDNAQAGQQALARLRAAQAALDKGDFDVAAGEAEAARQLAPWDRDVAGFSTRVAEARDRAQHEAEARAQSARAAQVNAALNQGATALQARQYEAAIAAYDQVLAVDPANVAAANGKQAAIGAKAIADAAASGPRPSTGKSLVAGRTEAKGNEQAGLVGFEDSAGVEVKRGTSAAELPGKLVFDAAPPAPRPGERFRVSAFLSNEGSQPIQLASMQITTTTDGKRQGGALPPATATVAPGQRALVFQTPGEMLWREGTQSWTMEIVLRTTKGETYRNTLSWK